MGMDDEGGEGREGERVGGEKMTTHPLIFHNLLCEGPQTLIFVAAPPPPLPLPEHPKSCNMYCYCRCRCLCFCGVVVELHTRCICVCVELKCYSGASGSNRGGNELGGGGSFPIGDTMPM